MKEYVTEGIVLKSRPRGEADRSAEVFTKDFGKLRLRVTGGRKILSKFSSHLEPLNLVSLRIVKKENYTLADILTKRSFMSRNFETPARRKALELVHFLSSQLPVGFSDLRLWFSFIRSLNSGKTDLKHFLKILGHDTANAKCFICASRSVVFYSLGEQTFLCQACFRKFPQNELICIR